MCIIKDDTFRDFTRSNYSSIFTKSKRLYCTTRNFKVDCFWQLENVKVRALKQYNARRGIKWRYNLSQAPWWVGLFERLIRSVKKCLIKSVIKMKLTYEQLTQDKCRWCCKYFRGRLKRRHWKVGKVLRINRAKDDVITGAAVQIFNEKMEKKPQFRNCIPW